MKRARDLSREELENIVESIQDEMYLDDFGNYDPDQEVNGGDMIDLIGQLMREAGLVPDPIDVEAAEPTLPDPGMTTLNGPPAEAMSESQTAEHKSRFVREEIEADLEYLTPEDAAILLGELKQRFNL